MQIVQRPVLDGIPVAFPDIRDIQRELGEQDQKAIFVFFILRLRAAGHNVANFADLEGE